MLFTIRNNSVTLLLKNNARKIILFGILVSCWTIFVNVAHYDPGIHKLDAEVSKIELNQAGGERSGQASDEPMLPDEELLSVEEQLNVESDLHYEPAIQKLAPEVSEIEPIQVGGEKSGLVSDKLLSVEEPLSVESQGVLKKRLPSAIIIGANKCGTQALLDMLGMHPQIVSAFGEIDFFNRDFIYEQGVEVYKEKMPNSYENQITIEKSPEYLRSYETPYRIHKYNASTKLILLVKEPVHRLLSGYVQVKAQIELGIASSYTGKGPLPTFEDYVIGPDGEVVKTEIVTDSIYWPHFKHYLEVFPRDQILVVNGDAFVDNPIPVIEKVEKFLNVREKGIRENLYFNEDKGFWCMRGDAAPELFKNTGCYSSAKGRKHEEVRPEVLSKLRKFFVIPNQHFYELTGIDFKWPSI